MAIFTPRGLKIRLPLDYSFSLMARLYPKVDAFKVLKTTEGLEEIPSLITLVTGIICFYLQLPLFEIGLYVFISSIVGFLLTQYKLYIIPGLIRLGILYSHISGFGILLVLLCVYGFITIGWQSVAIFLISKSLAGIVKIPIETKLMKNYENLGFVTASEENFFNAYRLHASKLGITTNITVSDEELREDNWKPVFEDLASKWPEVVRRFTTN